MREKQEILFHEYGTELRQTPDGSLVLNVLCGRVGQYGIEFVLNGVEEQEYRRVGDDFVRALSHAVQQTPSEYESRGRKC